VRFANIGKKPLKCPGFTYEIFKDEVYALLLPERRVFSDMLPIFLIKYQAEVRWWRRWEV